MCTSYSIDFTFLKEIKAYIENEIHNDQRNLPEEVVMSSLPDGRLIRTVYPQGYAAVERNPDKTLHFVGFIGFIKPTENLEPMLRERMWQIDNELMKELKDHPDIVAYSSAERVAGCDWANLVLFTCEEAIQKWRDSQLHWTAVLDISPKYYTNVRIHGGKLVGGLAGTFVVGRTLFLDYDKPEDKRRELKQWPEDQGCQF